MPALCGGMFGLLGGYLTDLLGRRRVLTYSILLYAFSAFAAGFTTSVYQLLFWRCCTFVGVCVEFVAAVAWLAELFADPKRRESVIGYTQAFGSLGGLHGHRRVLHLASPTRESFPPSQGGHAAWRYTLMSGLHSRHPADRHPAVPAGIAGLAREEGAGTLRRPSFAELFTAGAARARRSSPRS